MKVEVGDRIPEWRMASVSAARMRTMAAILRDPNPVHWDRRLVAQLGFGDRTINQGPLGLSYMLNMLHAWTGPTSIRRVVMRFPQVVLDGDEVVARGEVIGVRSSGDEKLADCRIWLELVSGAEGQAPSGARGAARGGELLEGTATVAIPG